MPTFQPGIRQVEELRRGEMEGGRDVEMDGGREGERWRERWIIKLPVLFITVRGSGAISSHLLILQLCTALHTDRVNIAGDCLCV